MSLLRRSQRNGESLLQGYIEGRRGSSIPGGVRVTNDTAMRHSAVWACIRMRADMVSTLPLDVFRKVDKIHVEVPKPPVLLAPGGEHWEYEEWMWASQADVDKAGNAVGIITKKNALGKAEIIELQPINAVSFRIPRGKTMADRKYKIDNKEYDAKDIWHERQFPLPGTPVGLSPVAYAAWSISEYMNIQQFALDWFAGGAVPKAALKNTKKTVPTSESIMMKERFKASMANGDLFVHGNDWEYDMIQAQAMDLAWLDAKRYGLSDVCRFFGCPADLIDATVSGGGTITYANITERNLQYLIHHLGPTIVRREKKLSSLVGDGRFVKLNTDALLRMDPKAVVEIFESRIKARNLTPTEAREKMNQAPLTSAQEDEFKRLFGDPAAKPSTPLKQDPSQKLSGTRWSRFSFEDLDKMNRDVSEGDSE